MNVLMRTAIFHQRILITIFLVYAMLFTGCNKQEIKEKQINVVFRYDDYSYWSSKETELKIIDVFRKNDAAITFGVIPFVCANNVHDPSPQKLVSLTSKQGAILKTGFKEGILDIALHGYSHQTIDAASYTEFSGLDYNNQMERLAKGKQFLEHIIDAPITIFVPPWNRYDLNTLRALEKLGFSTLSAGMEGAATENSKLNFLPATCTLNKLHNAIEYARISTEKQPVIVVLFHSYDFRENNGNRTSITFQEFYDLIAWLRSQEDVRLLSINQATKINMDLSPSRFLLASRINHIKRFLPPPLQRKSNIYTQAVSLPITWLKIGGFYLIIIFLGVVLFFSIGFLVLPKSTLFIKISTIGSIVLSVILVIYAFYDLQIHSKRLVVCTFIIGASFGLYLCFRYLKNKKISDGNSMD
jgi:predicted deacetylase